MSDIIKAIYRGELNPIENLGDELDCPEYMEQLRPVLVQKQLKTESELGLRM